MTLPLPTQLRCKDSETMQQHTEKRTTPTATRRINPTNTRFYTNVSEIMMRGMARVSVLAEVSMGVVTCLWARVSKSFTMAVSFVSFRCL